MRNYLYLFLVYPFVLVRYKYLRKVRKRGLLAVPGQQGLFFDCKTQEYVNYLDF